VELERLIAAARQAYASGLKVNAGHGLNYQNLPLLHTVPHLVELNIGHSIVSRANYCRVVCRSFGNVAIDERLSFG